MPKPWWMNDEIFAEQVSNKGKRKRDNCGRNTSKLYEPLKEFCEKNLTWSIGEIFMFFRGDIKCAIII